MELITVFLSAINLVPREAVLFSTGIMIFYFLFAPLDDAIWLFVASIPLFVALPITESFDHMSNWRILLIVLFLVLFFKVGVSIGFKDGKFKEHIFHYPMGYLIALFLIISGLSLFAAGDVWAGVKKIIFLINAFLLYNILRNYTERHPEFISKLIGAMKISITTILAAGFAQLIAVFFVPLHTFWYFWSGKVIATFYGQSLSTLLSGSNTWFSYYTYQLPTLRMFSLFPDSHSFGFFCVLSVPFFLTGIFLRKKESRFLAYSYLILCLSAILFCGSRGIWASAIGTILVLLFLMFFKVDRKCFQLGIGSLIILILLLPITSGILMLPQRLRGGDISEVSLFERARSIIDFDETSVRNRLQIWQKTAESIMKRPLLGVGIGNYPVVLEEDVSLAKEGSSAHNLYLDVTAESGIFALLILLVVFWEIFKTAWKVFQSNHQMKYWAGFFILAFVWILGYSVFDVVLLNDKVLLFFLANLGLLYASYSLHQHTDLEWRKVH